MNEFVCPKCRNMMRTYNRNGISIEQCDSCRGIFLDYGELEALTRVEAQYSAPPPAASGGRASARTALGARPSATWTRTGRIGRTGCGARAWVTNVLVRRGTFAWDGSVVRRNLLRYPLLRSQGSNLWVSIWILPDEWHDGLRPTRWAALERAPSPACSACSGEGWDGGMRPDLRYPLVSHDS